MEKSRSFSFLGAIKTLFSEVSLLGSKLVNEGETCEVTLSGELAKEPETNLNKRYSNEVEATRLKDLDDLKSRLSVDPLGKNVKKSVGSKGRSTKNSASRGIDKSATANKDILEK